ncbi:MAG: ATP-binding protein [Chloroflexota bacterium]
MVPRALAPRLLAAARKFPVVTVTGPRQSGKTTLCRTMFPTKAYVSLESPDVREYATSDPRGFLGDHRSGAILDEIQRAPALLSYLQGEVDTRREPGRFILTGSANLALLGSVSQSLAGRTAVLHLLPLSWNELGQFPAPPGDLWTALWKGGYPAIYDRGLDPDEWLASYVATYVERDVRQILNVGDLTTFQTFVRLCAGRSAQLLNLSALAADAGISHVTARSWISVLEASFVAFRLSPHHSNLTTRLVKTPKLHFYDSGLLCYLLGIRRPEHLRDHPLRGPVFETWVVDEVLKSRLHAGMTGGLTFFRDGKGREVDLLVEHGRALTAVETKSGQTVAEDQFAGLAAFAELIASTRRAPALRRVLVYGGSARQERTGGIVLPWSSIDRYDWTATS